ncbi:L-threonylcarbamoyladenylate synthase [Psychroflexus salis]|uniref:L-threonylcarbamoyladenylate synthase n=1 Tax=Psychroflexus salis TaxID=1526574 RepID=A0A916ZSQ6_9FLAO|nr:L-threonylcarbamoyladenylate synthase [Psychroflexus salis]GGE12185.1 translation factor Sua5 [Psychroflexus salis]
MREEIEQTIQVLKRGGLILYPTDTVWGIGCDATNANAVDKVLALKKRAQAKSLICLVSDFKMLNQYVEEIPEMAYDILKYADKPTTIIYPDPIRVAMNVINDDNTLGIRVCRNAFCNKLLKKFRKPIVSTSANFSGEPTPMRFSEISQRIKDSVDYIVDFDRNLKNDKPSTIIKLDLDGKVQVIRK